MRTAVKISIVFLVLMFVVGCVATQMEDGTTKHSLAPVWDERLEKVEEVGEGALGFLTALAPLLGPAGGAAVGSLATGLTILKKSRPKLEAVKDKYQLSNTVASISVDALEQVKKDHPRIWAELADKLQKECEESGIDTRVIKEAIRGLRGLPAKV